MASIVRELSIHDELIGRARELAPQIARKAKSVELRRAPDPEILQALIDAEFMEMLVPKRWGGHEASLQTHLEVVRTISEACMSTGWIAAFYIGHNFLATRMPERLQKEIFADRPYSLIPIANGPTITAEEVDGGWVLNGEAPWASGIMDAEWVFVYGKVVGGGPRTFALPVSDVGIDDVWYYAGMGGTGSNTIVIRDQFVPTYRSVTTKDWVNGRIAAELYENPIFSTPLMAFILCEVMPVYCGGLRGAANAFEQIVRTRIATFSKSKMSETSNGHIQLGNALTNAMAAERLVRDLVMQVEQGIEHNNIDISKRVTLKALSAFVVEHCRRSINEMAHNAGSSNYHLDSPIQRFFRDINMLSTHVFCEWNISRELMGRDCLGLEPNHPIV
ncbi:MAG: hypothetical protein GXP16_17695 [Gammaproteobacteria bacterium]|nr:hypothetical protein [Gammaproteobacteria bacterium]